MALAAAVLLMLTGAVPPRPALSHSRPDAQATPPTFGRQTDARFMLDQWTSESGLPQNSVLGTVRDKQGYLWIGTQEGVTRFDGVKFKVYKDAPLWANQDIFTNCLLAAADGSLWVGTRSGLNRIANDHFTTYTIQSGLPNKFITALAQDQSGTLWIGTRGGLARFSNGEFTTFTKTTGLMDDFIVSLLVASDQSLWIGTGKGMSRLKNGRFEHFNASNGFISAQINKLFEDRQGSLWVGTEGHGVLRVQSGQFIALTTRERLSNNNVYAIAEDGDGRLWIGTGNGLDYLEGGFGPQRLVNYSRAGSGLDDFIYHIYADHEGSIWIGTKGNGLARLRKSKFTVYGAAEGLSKDYVWCVLEARDGSVWVGLGAGGGLNRLKDGKIQTWSAKDGLIDDEVLSLLEARDGSLWVGTTGGLCHFQNGRFTCFTVEDGLSNDDVTAILEDTDGSLWIGTYAGLSHFKDGKFDTSCNQQGLDSSMIGDMLLSKSDGSLWLAALPEGLFRLKNGELKNFSGEYGLPLNQAVSVYEDAAGDLWIGTYQMGLKRVRPDGRVTSYSTLNGLPEDQVFDTLEDETGTLWLTSNHGLFRLPKRQFDEFDQGGIHQLTSTHYGMSDGLRTNECNGGSQPSGWKMRDGRLLIATIKGLVIADPRLIGGQQIAPPVVIEQVIADKQQIETGESVVVGPGVHDLEIRYTGLNLLTSAKTQFKYMLEGFDPNWVSAGTRRTAYYTNLPSGTYLFRVVAADAEDAGIAQGAVMHVRVNKFFFQRAWFYLLCATMLGMAALTFYRLRIARSRKMLLDRIAMSLPVAIAVLDNYSSVKMLNERFVNELGYSLSDLPTADHWFDLAFPDSEQRERARATWNLAMTTPYSPDLLSLQQEWQIRCKDGSDREVEVRFARAHDRAIVMLHDITYRKRAEESLRLSHQQMRELAARLQQAREEERAFIAREIHDELGQLLTGLKFDIKWFDKRLPRDAKMLRQKADSILELVDESIHALRRIATDFRPGVLDTLGLTAAIEWQAREFQKRTGIECEIGEQPLEQVADRQRETALFRIFQEALTNVARHSGATAVKVQLSRQNGSVMLQVRDNGRGITDIEINHSHSIGLLGMRERAHLFGGEVHFSGAPNQGTTVTASIPLDGTHHTGHF